MVTILDITSQPTRTRDEVNEFLLNLNRLTGMTSLSMNELGLRVLNPLIHLTRLINDFANLFTV